jgi:hypothetical protein
MIAKGVRTEGRALTQLKIVCASTLVGRAVRCTPRPALPRKQGTRELPREFPITFFNLLTSRYGVGRGCGVGRGLGVTLGVAVGVAEGVGVGVTGVGVGVGVVGVGVGVGVGLAHGGIS